jgi:RNA polymerase sigma-54 factor
MQFGLSQRLEQRLKMTAQMIQSIEMLQLPLMALEQQINQQLAENPVLEIVEEEVEVAPGEAEEAEREEEGDFAKLEEIARDEEWEDSISSSRPMRVKSGEEDPKLSAMMNTAARSETLQEHIAEQIRLSDAPDRIKAIALVIAFELDDNGYLLLPPEQIFDGRDEDGKGDEDRDADAGDTEQAEEEDALGPVSPEEAVEALALIQGLDPAGVGAQKVEECLLLQLRREEAERRKAESAGRGPRAEARSKGNGPSFEELLIRDHFDDLLHNRLPKVASGLGVDIERVKQGMARIAHLNPRPGREFAPGAAQYVVPDVIIEEMDGDYVLRLNDSLPPLRISPVYRELLKQQKRGSSAKQFLREKMQAGKWLIDSIAMRRNTVEKIATEIVKAQRGFLEKGVSELKPLMMQEVADIIGMHVSTVSRATADKYVDTPQGIFPMRYFFTGGYKTGAEGGDAVSNRSVMNRISEMIGEEDKKKPLSDSAIAKRLKGEGLDIARRTVAKYREKLSIPASRQRKQY